MENVRKSKKLHLRWIVECEMLYLVDIFEIVSESFVDDTNTSEECIAVVESEESSYSDEFLFTRRLYLKILPSSWPLVDTDFVLSVTPEFTTRLLFEYFFWFVCLLEYMNRLIEVINYYLNFFCSEDSL